MFVTYCVTTIPCLWLTYELICYNIKTLIVFRQHETDDDVSNDGAKLRQCSDEPDVHDESIPVGYNVSSKDV